MAHDPVQFDLVEVSGTNQYSVRPLRVGEHGHAADLRGLTAADDAVLEDELAAADGLPEAAEPPVDELPHAAARNATAAKPTAANHR